MTAFRFIKYTTFTIDKMVDPENPIDQSKILSIDVRVFPHEAGFMAAPFSATFNQLGKSEFRGFGETEENALGGLMMNIRDRDLHDLFEKQPNP